MSESKYKDQNQDQKYQNIEIMQFQTQIMKLVFKIIKNKRCQSKYVKDILIQRTRQFSMGTNFQKNVIIEIK